MTQTYYAATGKPFTDQDAAQIKADTMSLELGEDYRVTQVEDGYVITQGEGDLPDSEPHKPLYPEIVSGNPYPESHQDMESPKVEPHDQSVVVDTESTEEEVKLPVYTPVPEREPERDMYQEYMQSPYNDDSAQEAAVDPDIADESPLVQDEDSTTNEFSEKYAGKLREAADEADARHQAKEKEERETLKEIKIRPAWISQWHWGVMVVAGFTIAIFPTLFPILLLGVGETQAMVAEYPWALDMMNYIGLGMAGYAAYMAINVALAYEYRITPTTVHAKEGIVSRKKIRIDLANVVNLELTQSAQERMIGVGNIEFSSAGTGDVDLTFRQIDTPEKIHEIIKNRIDNVRKHMKQMHR